VMDLFRRRDVRGWVRAGWFLLVLLLPIIGTVIYLVARPGEEREGEEGEATVGKKADLVVASDVEQLERLARLRDVGSISEEEFAVLKARIVQQ
jgi:hypothetical protein